MKTNPLKLNLFGWKIYLSRKSLRFYVNRSNRGGLAHRLKEKRNRRYRKLHGCCEACGHPSEKDNMQMHHILPYATFPNLAAKEWNLILLCRHCHYLVHHNPVWNMELMQRTANGHNVNLKTAFHISAAHMWQNRELEIEGGLV